MATSDGQRVTPKMLLLGLGLDSLDPTRRLLMDLYWLLITLAGFIAIGLAFDFSRQSMIIFPSVFIGLNAALAVVRYFRASRR